MKKIAVLVMLSLSMSIVYADNLFQSNNPFPQTSPQTMNNIYESEPAQLMKEQNKQEKAKKSWFKRKKKAQQYTESSDYVVPNSKIIHEGNQEGSYYVFK